jgi:hypothetical protein
MPKSKTSAFFSVLLVFLSGAAMGAVGYRLYAVKTVASTNPSNPSGQPMPPRKSPEEIRKAIINSLKDKVKLDDRQTEDIQKIYQDQHESFDQVHGKYQTQLDQVHADWKGELDRIHDGAVVKIKAILRPDQVPLYDKWQADRAAAQADRKRKQDREHPDGRGGHDRPPMPRPQWP